MPLTTQGFDYVVNNKLKMKLRQGKHLQYFLEHDGKVVLWTQRSHGRGEIGRVENAIRRQLKVNSEQMRKLVDCSMTREAYIAHLAEIGVIAKTGGS